MRNTDEQEQGPGEPIEPGKPIEQGGRYALEISSVITDLWDERLEGWDIERLPGDHTRVSGYVRDQSELYGVLTALRNMGLTLVRVEPVSGFASGGASGADASITGAGHSEEEEGVTL